MWAMYEKLYIFMRLKFWNSRIMCPLTLSQCVGGSYMCAKDLVLAVLRFNGSHMIHILSSC